MGSVANPLEEHASMYVMPRSMAFLEAHVSALARLGRGYRKKAPVKILATPITTRMTNEIGIERKRGIG